MNKWNQIFYYYFASTTVIPSSLLKLLFSHPSYSSSSSEEENDDESDIEQQKKDKKTGHRHTFGVTKKDAPTDTEDNHVPILLWASQKNEHRLTYDLKLWYTIFNTIIYKYYE